jgi:transposase-like protein
MVGNHAEEPTGPIPGRHFQDHVIVLCVIWYLRYCLTLRELEEMMAEGGLGVDHSTNGKGVQAHRERHLRAGA